MKELALQISVKNNRLKQTREELGFKTCAAFCVANDITLYSYCRLETMKDSAISKRTGLWTNLAIKVAAAMGKDASYLFPDDIKSLIANKVEYKIDAADLELLGLPTERPSIEETYLKKECSEKLTAALNMLALRDKEVVVSTIVEGYLLDEVGSKFSISRERVRQIQQRGLRLLKRYVGEYYFND